MHHLSAVHMFHRYAAAILGALLLYGVWQCAVGVARSAGLRRLAWLALAAFVIQIIVGAVTVWLDFQPHWRAAHLTAATAAWTATAGMAMVAWFNAHAAGDAAADTDAAPGRSKPV